MGRIKDFFTSLRIRLMSRSRGIYYINGPELLPPPLEREEEADYLERSKTDCEARNKLVEHNLRLVVYIAKRFENTGTGIEDLISIGTMGLIKAINTFDGNKNIRLATYASRCIENEILMYIRKYSGHVEMSIDEPLNVDWDGNELLLSDILGNEEDTVNYEFEQSEERRMIHEAVAALDDRERIIIEMRYGLNGFREHTQKEAADELGISQSYISRIEKKILTHLKCELAGKL